MTVTRLCSSPEVVITSRTRAVAAAGRPFTPSTSTTTRRTRAVTPSTRAPMSALVISGLIPGRRVRGTGREGAEGVGEVLPGIVPGDERRVDPPVDGVDHLPVTTASARDAPRVPSTLPSVEVVSRGGCAEGLGVSVVPGSVSASPEQAVAPRTSPRLSAATPSRARRELVMPDGLLCRGSRPHPASSGGPTLHLCTGATSLDARVPHTRAYWKRRIRPCRTPLTSKPRILPWPPRPASAPTTGSSTRCSTGSPPIRAVFPPSGPTTSPPTAAPPPAPLPQRPQRRPLPQPPPPLRQPPPPPSPVPRPRQPPRQPRPLLPHRSGPPRWPSPARPAPPPSRPAGTSSPVAKDPAPAAPAAASDEPTYTVLRGAPARTVAEHGRLARASRPPPRSARCRSSCCGTTGSSSTTTWPGPAAARCPSPTSSATRWSRRCGAMPEMNVGFDVVDGKPTLITAGSHQPGPGDRPAQARRHPTAAGALHQGRRVDGLRGLLDGVRGDRAQGARRRS